MQKRKAADVSTHRCLCVHGRESFRGQEREVGMLPRTVLDFSGIRHKSKKEWLDPGAVVCECGLVLQVGWWAVPGDYPVTCLDCLAVDNTALLSEE